MPAWIKNFSTWLRRTIGGMVTEHDNQTHDLVKHGGWIGLFSVVTSHFYQLCPRCGKRRGAHRKGSCFCSHRCARRLRRRRRSQAFFGA